MIDDLDSDFEITSAHLIMLCDGVLQGELASGHLEIVAFSIIGSDHFEWGTERVGETIPDWGAPEANYELSPETVAKFRHRLATGEDTFTDQDLSKEPAGNRVVWNAGDN